MKDMRKEVGTTACIVGKIMKDDKLPKRSETNKQ